MKTEATLWTRDQATTTLGIISEPAEVYHASAGLSYSGLKQFAKTPAHFLAYLDSDRAETGAQRLGTLAHMAILERERFERTVQVIDGHRGTNAVKAAIAEAEANGKYVCKPQEYEDARRMADAVYKSPLIAKLLSGGQAEQSIRWRDPETGVLLRCRPDYLRKDGVVVDVKTYEDLSEESVQRQIAKMKYHWQSAFYLAGVNQTLKLETKMFAHVFIDTKAFVARVVVLDDPSITLAENEIRPLINAYAESLKANNWPGYPEEILTTGLPSYAWR